MRPGGELETETWRRGQTVPDPIGPLPEIGRLLLGRAIARGAITLPRPEQGLESDGDGWRLVLRGPVPVEEYNAQISLLTGVSETPSGPVAMPADRRVARPTASGGVRRAAPSRWTTRRCGRAVRATYRSANG